MMTYIRCTVPVDIVHQFLYTDFFFAKLEQPPVASSSLQLIARASEVRWSDCAFSILPEEDCEYFLC